MVERVARAMFHEFDRLVRRDNPGIAERVPPRQFDDEEHRVQSFWLSAARLGIHAMREPSAAMTSAGESVEDTDHGGHAGYIDDIWSGMIDAALTEAEESEG